MEFLDTFNASPFSRLLGLEVTEAEGGSATGHLEYSPDILSSPDGEVLHGGATYALADSVGGAAVVSQYDTLTPTVDLRIDYLAPATTALDCEATVIRGGAHLAMVRADVYDSAETHVATAHGTYKTGGQGEDTPWGPTTGPTDE